MGKFFNKILRSWAENLLRNEKGQTPSFQIQVLERHLEVERNKSEQKFTKFRSALEQLGNQFVPETENGTGGSCWGCFQLEEWGSCNLQHFWVTRKVLQVRFLSPEQEKTVYIDRPGVIADLLREEGISLSSLLSIQEYRKGIESGCK